MTRSRKELKAASLLLLIVAIAIPLWYFTIYNMQDLDFSYPNWLIIIGYVLLILLLALLENKFSRPWTKFIFMIVSFPMTILYVIASIILPFGALYISLLYYLFLAAILPVAFVELNENQLWFELTEETGLFIILTFSSCIALLFHSTILKIVLKLSPLRLKSSEKMKSKEMAELVEHILCKENLRFVIYLGFFCFMTYYSVQILNQVEEFNSILDKPVLQAFLCFIALDRVIQNSKMARLLPSQLLQRFSTAIFGKEEKNST